MRPFTPLHALVIDAHGDVFARLLQMAAQAGGSAVALEYEASWRAALSRVAEAGWDAIIFDRRVDGQGGRQFLHHASLAPCAPQLILVCDGDAQPAPCHAGCVMLHIQTLTSMQLMAAMNEARNQATHRMQTKVVIRRPGAQNNDLLDARCGSLQNELRCACHLLQNLERENLALRRLHSAHKHEPLAARHPAA